MSLTAHFALDQGPIVLMIENHRSGLLWRLMRRCRFVVDGLPLAGFTHGWLTRSGMTAERMMAERNEN